MARVQFRKLSKFVQVPLWTRVNTHITVLEAVYNYAIVYPNRPQLGVGNVEAPVSSVFLRRV